MTGRWLAATLMLLAARYANAAPRAFVRDVLAAHNDYRKQVGTPPLQWSDELAARAQHWAAKLIESGTYAPRRPNEFGENLFEISGGQAWPASVVGAWAAEGAFYDHATNSCSRRCGHFTQVVWRSTRLVGCGVARSARREVWVCDYDPHGNTVGEEPY